MDATTIIGGATLTETTPTDITFVGQSVTIDAAMGQIVSTATPDKNLLNTGSLSYEDLDNRSHWSAEQTGLSLGGHPLPSAWGSAGAGLG